MIVIGKKETGKGPRSVRKPCIRCCSVYKDDDKYEGPKHSRKGRNSTLLCGTCKVVLCQQCFDDFHKKNGTMPPCYNPFRGKPGPKPKKEECIVIHEVDNTKCKTAVTQSNPQRFSMQQREKNESVCNSENSALGTAGLSSEEMENSTPHNGTQEEISPSVVQYSSNELDNSGIVDVSANIPSERKSMGEDKDNSLSGGNLIVIDKDNSATGDESIEGDKFNSPPVGESIEEGGDKSPPGGDLIRIKKILLPL